MSLVLNRPAEKKTEIEYPTSDGKRMAENTLQYEYLTTIKDNLEILYANDADVFIAGDLLWYPVEGDNRTRLAPDVFVAFGRPKGYRGAYLQWREGNTPPQVVFEILSPGNRRSEMERKLAFYQQYGVEEYYEYDPERHRLRGWLRNSAGILEPLTPMDDWISPRLGVRFDISGSRLVLFDPDGQPFRDVIERERDRQQAEQERNEAMQELNEVMQRAEQLAARLRALGIDPDTP